MVNDAMAALELLKLVLAEPHTQRSAPKKAEIFALYRECLATVRDQDSGGNAAR